MLLISVIIPTRNRAFFVQQAIESVLACSNEIFQTEIIVIDDGSTDSTPEIVQTYPIRYILGPAGGASVARNIGIRASTGHFITFLDDDDAWPANNLIRQVNFLEENPQFGAVCSQVMLTDDGFTQYAGPYPSQPFQSGWMFNDFLRYIPQVGSLLVRREVVDAVGSFDTSLQGGEDWDWALRIARHCQIGFVSQVALLWRMHNASRIDGAGNKRAEDITWRRFTDVMHVAHRHIMKESPLNWLNTQKIIFKHKGHYIPIFMGYSFQYFQKCDIRASARCYWLALRISPLHVASHLARVLIRSIRPSLPRSV
jgi:glycosyltransferase involved in cell wall biosynthesis